MAKIVICGLGAVGSNMLIQLSLARPDDEFVGVDYDVVEDRNMYTQIYFSELKKMPKAKAANVVLTRYLKSPRYQAVQAKIGHPQQILELKPDLVIDGFDNKASREVTCGLGVSTLHVGFSPDGMAEVIWDEKYNGSPEDIKSEIDICVLTAAGPFIRYATGFASMVAQNYLDGKIKRSYLLSRDRIRDL